MTTFDIIAYLTTVPYFERKKGTKNDFSMCPYFCKNLSIDMYRKFRIFFLSSFPPICPYFLGTRVGRHTKYFRHLTITVSFI